MERVSYELTGTQPTIFRRLMEFTGFGYWKRWHEERLLYRCGTHELFKWKGKGEMYNKRRYELTSLAPTLLHNGRLNDPFQPISAMLKEVNSRRQKTEKVIKLVADLEWLGSFYPSEPGEAEIHDDVLSFTGFGVPNWPQEALEGMLKEAAAQHKLKQKFRAGVLIQNRSIIDFGEKKTIEQIFRDPAYRDYRAVKLKGKTIGIMRCRPIFHNWKLQVEVQYMEELLNAQQITTVIETAGQRIGLSDYRPETGRFTVQELKTKN